MQKIDKRLLEIIAEKPDLLIEFPGWMLPASTINELRGTKNIAIAEIAGRDSFAAVFRACESRPINAVIPTIAYTGTEYGDWSISLKKIEQSRKRLREKNIKLYAPIILGAPRFWWKLCGRFTTHFFKTLGSYSHCLGCHLYFHASRIPIAKQLDCELIIGGERESHDGRIKINQIGIVLDIYQSFMKRYGIELFLPIRHIESGNEVESILGMDWDEGDQQLKCVLSKNYLEVDGSVSVVEEAVKRYFDEFALKTAEEIVDGYLQQIK